MTHIGLDATGSASGNIPLSTPSVFAYITGSQGVPWTAAQIARYHNSGVGLINQDDDANPQIGSIFDLEAHAGDVPHGVRWCKGKLDRGSIGVVYLQQSNLDALERALAQAGIGRYWIWLANWNLSRAEAERRLGGHIRAIQCQSPTSNPNTPVPGSHLTLAQANIDVSVCADDFFPPPHALPTPHGIANARLSVDLAAGDWHVHPAAGNVRFGVHGTGQWDVEPLPAEGEHWCAKVRIDRGH